MAFPTANERAFNMFTALVSFLLIMLAVLLVNSMIQTERKASETIAAIESRSDLEAVAEMARADAMQVFNYALRKKIEDWLTGPGGELTLQLQDKSWEEIKRQFAESKFGGAQSSAFAEFTSNALIGIFYDEAHFGNYLISLEGRETLKGVLQDAVVESLDDFFTVIDCDDGDPKNCPRGTFYVNLHLERLTQEQYESLPKLHVIDKASGEELKEVILPRTTFRIYVPLRFFKAIAEARALTHFPLDEIDTGSDKGLFSPRVHNTIEEIALGMCDRGYCAPRSNPFTPPSSTGTGAGPVGFCPGDNEASGYGDGIIIPITCPYEWCQGIQKRTYNANDNDDLADMKTSVAQIANAKVCSVVKEAKTAGFVDADPDDGFTLAGNECENLAFDIEVGVDANPSKSIQIGGGGQAAGNGWTQGYEPDTCPRPNEFGISPSRRLGLFVGDGGKAMHPVISLGELPCTGSSDKKANCAEVKYVKVTLAFKEENPVYTVAKPGEGESHVYKISLYDNTYVPFTANWGQTGINADCLYSGEPANNSCSLEKGQGWYCVSTYSEEMGVGRVYQGCVPG